MLVVCCSSLWRWFSGVVAVGNVLWLFCSPDVEFGLHKVVVGIERGGSVGGDVVEHGLPWLWAKKVVKLDFITIWPFVCVDLVEVLSHPGLWEAEVVCVAEFHQCCGVVGCLWCVLVLWVLWWYSMWSSEVVIFNCLRVEL